jgi:D-arabinose 1-dehydrogenase-like Zn-dependent alcohol dehydrogenase
VTSSSSSGLFHKGHESCSIHPSECAWQDTAISFNSFSTKETIMKKGEKLVIIGCSGAGGPAALTARQLMPDVDVTVIRKEEHFIVR